jgi:hypothetical protein
MGKISPKKILILMESFALFNLSAKPLKVDGGSPLFSLEQGHIAKPEVLEILFYLTRTQGKILQSTNC